MPTEEEKNKLVLDSFRENANTHEGVYISSSAAKRILRLVDSAASPAPLVAAGAGQWVPVGERLPEEPAENHWPNRVLIVRPNEGIKTGYHDNGGWYAEGEDYDGDALLDNTVTHWMPLPAAPQPEATPRHA